MGDLDALLQDFSYLKSLEYKNQAPKKPSKKLELPDHTVSHTVTHLFRQTGEAVFERIFHRPIGRRCFAAFLQAEAEARSGNTAGHLLISFIAEQHDLSSDRADVAHKRALEVQAKYLDNAALTSLPTLWEPQLRTDYDAKLLLLTARAAEVTPEATMSKTRNVNIKDLFAPFAKAARVHLSGDAFDRFQLSPFWTRYMQWKQLESNMTVSEADFDIHRILGRGGFGEVYGCRKFDTGALFAVKKLDKKRLKDKHQESSAVHERNVLSEMHSKFVTNLKYAFHDRDTLYLVLDLCEGGDLQWHLKRSGGHFTESQAKFYAAEIIMGVAHIHDNGFIFRDLKPANILLDGDGHARISDLGLVRDVKNKALPTSECGTHGYMAPEVMRKEAPYSYASDWFSLGCTIFQFLTGNTPFLAEVEGRKPTKAVVLERTTAGVITYPDEMGDHAKDLMAKLLQVDPEKRLGSAAPPRGATEIRRHPWFADIDWVALTDHKLRPPIKPMTGMVNASSVHEIERFNTADVRSVKVTEEDNQKYYRHFNHVMSHQWQEEVLVMYDAVTKLTDAREAKERAVVDKLRRKGKLYDAEAIAAEAGEEIVMQGYWLKKSKRLGSWNRRYVRLYEDRIVWANHHYVAPKFTLSLAGLHVEEAPFDPAGKKPGQQILLRGGDGVNHSFRTLYHSCHAIWKELIGAAIEATGPAPNKRRLTEALNPADAGGRKPRKLSMMGDQLSEEERGEGLAHGLRVPSGTSAPHSPIAEE